MGKIVGGWDRPEVAQAQYDLVLKELSADPATIGPYAAFLWAMGIVFAIPPDVLFLEKLYIEKRQSTLLDAGCGVGHYGVLCERFYPNTQYHGTDISQATIDQARQLAPLSTFSVCDFKDNDFGDYDIVLAGQTIEQLDDPPAMLDLLLMRARRYIILNRIRLTPDESHRIEEGTYCGEMGRTWLWNRADITRRIEKCAQIVAVNDWWATDQMTFVVKRRENDESAELCGCVHEMDAICTH